MRVDLFDKCIERLTQTVVDPGLWPDVMEELCLYAGAKGAVLLQTDVRTADVPRTQSLADAMDGYFKHGWHLRDGRSKCIPMLQNGENVIIDQDILTLDEIARSEFYNECLMPSDSPWFAAVGFRAGNALWVMSMQRSVRQGPFEQSEKTVLAMLSHHLTRAATLSTAVGRSCLAGITNALDRIAKPAVAIDRMGLVLDANAAAEALFDDDVRVHRRMLVFRDVAARTAFSDFLDQLNFAAPSAFLAISPIIVRRRARPPIIINALPIDGAASTPFLGARALLILSDLDAKPKLKIETLQHLFALTPAEARLAAHMANGYSIDEIASTLHIARETARNQLKLVFSKTGVRRQGELIALLARI